MAAAAAATIGSKSLHLFTTWMKMCVCVHSVKLLHSAHDTMLMMARGLMMLILYRNIHYTLAFVLLELYLGNEYKLVLPEFPILKQAGFLQMH